MLVEELTPNKVDHDHKARSYGTTTHVNRRKASTNSKDDKPLSIKAKSPPLRLSLKISKPNPNKPTKSLDEVMQLFVAKKLL